jgi:hypothetical protein
MQPRQGATPPPPPLAAAGNSARAAAAPKTEGGGAARCVHAHAQRPPGTRLRGRRPFFVASSDGAGERGMLGRDVEAVVRGKESCRAPKASCAGSGAAAPARRDGAGKWRGGPPACGRMLWGAASPTNEYGTPKCISRSGQCAERSRLASAPPVGLVVGLAEQARGCTRFKPMRCAATRGGQVGARARALRVCGSGARAASEWHRIEEGAGPITAARGAGGGGQSPPISSFLASREGRRPGLPLPCRPGPQKRSEELRREKTREIGVLRAAGEDRGIEGEGWGQIATGWGNGRWGGRGVGWGKRTGGGAPRRVRSAVKAAQRALSRGLPPLRPRAPSRRRASRRCARQVDLIDARFQ